MERRNRNIMNNFSYTKKNLYPSTAHTHKDTATEDTVSVQGNGAHKHTHTYKQWVLFTKNKQSKCKSFRNPFLRKLSHKHYSDRISFAKDFPFAIIYTRMHVISCTDSNGIEIFGVFLLSSSVYCLNGVL